MKSNCCKNVIWISFIFGWLGCLVMLCMITGYKAYKDYEDNKIVYDIHKGDVLVRDIDEEKPDVFIAVEDKQIKEKDITTIWGETASISAQWIGARSKGIPCGREGIYQVVGGAIFDISFYPKEKFKIVANIDDSNN
jgi:hypothetical protein